MTLVRMGNKDRWATKYANGWTVFDKTKGVLACDASIEEAKRLVRRVYMGEWGNA